MPQVLRCPRDGSRIWFGMDDFEIRSPDGHTTLILPSVGEALRGDSQHKVLFQDWVLPGYAWGDGLAWSACSSFLAIDWLSDLCAIERHCIIVDIASRSTFTLPNYVAVSRFKYPHVYAGGSGNERLVFVFTGQEHWSRVAA